MPEVHRRHSFGTGSGGGSFGDLCGGVLRHGLVLRQVRLQLLVHGPPALFRQFLTVTVTLLVMITR